MPRISPRERAAGATGSDASSRTTPHSSSGHQLVEHRGKTASGGVAQEAQTGPAGEQVVDQAVQGSAVAAQRRGEVQAFAGGEDRQTVVAQRAVDEHRVAGPGLAPPGGEVVAQLADAGGGDEDAVGAAALDHLGVAGDQRHARGAGGGGHGVRDAVQVVQRQALLEDERTREEAGPRAHDREVVDRAGDRQGADVAAREEGGRDDVARRW